MPHDRVEYAAKVRALLERATFSRDQLAREAGISFRALRFSIAPASAERANNLPRMARALANALELRAQQLPAIVAELRKLADEGEQAFG